MICPLKIYTEKEIIWQNPVPGGSRYCRPISIQFIHETADQMMDEYNLIVDQIESIGEFERLEINGIESESRFCVIAHPTMLDGKSLNAIVENNCTQRCRICFKTWKGFY